MLKICSPTTVEMIHKLRIRKIMRLLASPVFILSGITCAVLAMWAASLYWCFILTRSWSVEGGVAHQGIGVVLATSRIEFRIWRQPSGSAGFNYSVTTVGGTHLPMIPFKDYADGHTVLEKMGLYLYHRERVLLWHSASISIPLWMPTFLILIVWIIIVSHGRRAHESH